MSLRRALLTPFCRRDLTALLCFVEPQGINSRIDLYLEFLEVVSQQVTSMDTDLLEVSFTILDYFRFQNRILVLTIRHSIVGS